MNLLFINILQLLLYLFAILFIINIIKTRVYIYLILNFFVYIIFVSFIFYFLQYEVIAFLLILVYAGAVVILFTFVVMLYENHKLLFISSSYLMVLFLYLFTSIFMFFLLNVGQLNYKHHRFLMFEKIFKGFKLNDFYQDLLTYLEYVLNAIYKYSSKQLEKGVKFDDCMNGNLTPWNSYRVLHDMVLDELLEDYPRIYFGQEGNRSQYFIMFYNYIDSLAYSDLRVPHLITVADNILFREKNFNTEDYTFYLNRPLKIIDPVTGNKFIMDAAYLDLFEVFSPFCLNSNPYWNLDLYSLLMYTEHHLINSTFEVQEGYTVLPQRVNIEWRFPYLNTDKFNHLGPVLTERHALFYYENYDALCNLAADWFDMNIVDFGRALVSYNNLFKIFDDISIAHTRHVLMHEFYYVNMKGEYLFNIIGLYIYTNCIFEFMVLGLMLFICLICIMRLLKKEF